MMRLVLVVCFSLGVLSAVPEIRPFKIEVDQKVLDALYTKLAGTTWPEQIEPITEKWEQGTDQKYLKELVAFWQNHYDWRIHEKKLNQLAQFVTEIDGLDLHFIHVKSNRSDAKPLLFLHGWPGSILECTKIVHQLTNPSNDSEPAFHFVCPSLPGYGFSGKPKEFGWGPKKMASVFNQLMIRLGYSKYITQGGDWGAIIGTKIGEMYVDNCIGLHINFHFTGLPWRRGIIPFIRSAAISLFPSLFLSETEQKNLRDNNIIKSLQQTGYMHIQGTKPQTVGYGLSDSPVGLAAYIVEKFHAWSDCNNNIESRFTKDELLTNIMIYWVTTSISSSVKLYWEFFQDPETIPWLGTQYVTVPTGYALFKDIQNAVSEKLMHYNYNLISFTQMPEGGHFAALEVPELLVQDIRKFYRILNSDGRKK